jgi:hypothetical protein
VMELESHESDRLIRKKQDDLNKNSRFFIFRPNFIV